MPDIFGREGKRPTVACDLVVFSEKDGELMVLLVERGKEPFLGMWALPGGFMEWDESCEQTANRELEEETGLKDVDFRLLGVYSEPGRDPRGTIVSVSYLGHAIFDTIKLRAGDDAAKAAWYPVKNHPPLGFDHEKILADGIKAFRRHSN